MRGFAPAAKFMRVPETRISPLPPSRAEIGKSSRHIQAIEVVSIPRWYWVRSATAEDDFQQTVGHIEVADPYVMAQ